jgi:iron complex outermembrane receptor protein
MDIYGAITKNHTAAYRINTTYEKGKSFRDNVTAARYYINPSFLFKVGKKTDVLIEGDYLNDNRTADFGVGAIDYSLISVPRNRFIGVLWSHYKAEQQGSTLTLTHHFNSQWQLSNVTAYQKYQSDLFANQRPNGNSQFIKPNGDWIRGIQKTIVNEDYCLTQLDITGKFSTGFLKHLLIIGADADKYLTSTTSYNPINRYDTINVFNPDKYKSRTDIPALTPRTLTTNPLQRAGLYVQDLLSLNEKIKLLAGARISYLETFSNTYTHSNYTEVKTEKYDHAISPRIGLVYQPVKTIALFASYSNSFTPNTGVDIHGEALPPSLINQYEIGIKNDLFKNLLSVNLTAYQIKNSNLAQVSLANGNTNANIKELAGEVTSKGIEVDITSREYKGISVIAGYSFNDTRYTKSNTYIVGSPLRYNPNHTANTSVYYHFKALPIKWMQGFNAGLGALYIGKRMAGRSTRVNVTNDTYKLIPLPEYVTLEASVGYAINKVSLRFKMNNLSNVLSYHVHDDNSINPIAPRQFIITAGIKF